MKVRLKKSSRKIKGFNIRPINGRKNWRKSMHRKFWINIANTNRNLYKKCLRTIFRRNFGTGHLQRGSNTRGRNGRITNLKYKYINLITRWH
jgi:hypothetical protein